MADPAGHPSSALAPLLSKMEAHPYRFGFFSAIRFLDAVFRDSPRTGEALRRSDEALSIGQEASLNFAPATLASFKRRPGQEKWHLQTYFFGLFGPNGPLPYHLTEYARDRSRQHRDTTFADFADVFHHRLATLFYRAWSQGQPAVQMDRPELDRFTHYIGSLFGLGLESLRNQDALPDHAKLFYAAYNAGQPRHAAGLAAMIQGFFDCNVRIEECVGHWIKLPENCRLQLSSSSENCRLGQTTTLGERVWDLQQKFRVVLGPLDYKTFQRFLPGGRSLLRVIAMVRNYIGDELFWELKLVLKKADRPAIQLGRSGQLGWTTWLSSQPASKDPDELILQPLDYANGTTRRRTSAA